MAARIEAVVRRREGGEGKEERCRAPVSRRESPLRGRAPPRRPLGQAEPARYDHWGREPDTGEESVGK
eukprot:441420-Alexandrium_andersonii.AAC.1